ncbi:MAG: dinitrogenase iron-molybdenum cofactor biosynthesis protein [Desulfobacteraceae bacterium]|nr:MAG: dinitrogenase iron-molybdenum cofactor biosynthesis protein [Desulfobacteraceae bacterium]
MKIAFSSTGRDLDSEIDPRFGRCAYFLIVDPDDMSFEAFENESMSLGGGAGIQSGQFIASKGANVVITGNVGPNASRTLNAAGLDVIVGVSGPIREAIERYKRGELSPTNQANVPDHYGMGMGGGQSASPGAGMGMGGGMGRGMGGGMGRGMGMGGGMGRGMGMQGGYAPNQAPSTLSPDQELGALKEDAKALRDQLDSILSRIKDLEK